MQVMMATCSLCLLWCFSAHIHCCFLLEIFSQTVQNIESRFVLEPDLIMQIVYNYAFDVVIPNYAVRFCIRPVVTPSNNSALFTTG